MFTFYIGVCALLKSKFWLTWQTLIEWLYWGWFVWTNERNMLFLKVCNLSNMWKQRLLPRRLQNFLSNTKIKFGHSNKVGFELFKRDRSNNYIVTITRSILLPCLTLHSVSLLILEVHCMIICCLALVMLSTRFIFSSRKNKKEKCKYPLLFLSF